MDLIGPLPETPRGNKYIVILTDYFSKWAEAAPLQDKTALEDKTALGVAKFIFSVRVSTKSHVSYHVKALYNVTETDSHHSGHVQDGLSRDPDY